MDTLTLVRKIRLERDITQSKLSHIVKVHPSALSNIENQKITAWPRLRKDIARALNMKADLLFDDRGMARGVE